MQELQDGNIEFVGVRRRKWGKWVSEIREPGKKNRIWLGSYEEPQMAAAAYDVAALHLKGPNARLNFPQLVDSFPRPASNNAQDIQLAAQQAAMQLRKGGVTAEVSGGGSGSGSGSGMGPVRVGLSPSQIQAINESPLDSPKMWMELAITSASLGVQVYNNQMEDTWDAMDSYSIWD